MILISKRGNINGPNPAKENRPGYIEKALDAGFDVQVDIFFDEDDNRFFLGDSDEKIEVPVDYFSDKRIWCWCRSAKALHQLLCIRATCFIQNTDGAALTSNGYIWSYPETTLTPKSICYAPSPDTELGKCAGVCSSYIENYRRVK